MARVVNATRSGWRARLSRPAIAATAKPEQPSSLNYAHRDRRARKASSAEVIRSHGSKRLRASTTSPTTGLSRG